MELSRDQLKKIVFDYFDKSRPKLKGKFVESWGLYKQLEYDSTSVDAMFDDIEKLRGVRVKIPTVERNDITTLGQLIDFIFLKQ